MFNFYGYRLNFLAVLRLSVNPIETLRLGVDNKKRVWGSGGCSRWPYSCRLQPHELFFRVFQASKANPKVGVERRGEVKTTDFDQINETRSPVTNKMRQNASISDCVTEL